ncbi:facilitated trehalose transporter Tret1-like [Epargyreus clarus]|uniref:facilitated trehalose transporter Tret1-like n=1 Tax=Epargyreus clarus TaxID=520877 RepID=UPI003C30584A
MPNKLTPLLRQCFVTAAVCINVIGNGCGFGFPGVLLPQTQEGSTSVELTPEEQSWIASVISITILIGDFAMPPIMGRLGRKIGHLAVLAPIIAAWITMIFATSFEALLIGRILQGLSFGLLVPLRSVLIGEYTSPKYRGAFLAMISLSQGFGIFFVHLIGSLLNWRHTAIISLAFPAVSLVMTFFLPESPSWLADKGKYDKCRESFKWLRGDEEDQELEELIQARIDYKESYVRREHTNVHKYLFVVIRKKEFYKPIILMMHVFPLMYLAGSMNMAVYATKIIELIMGPTVNLNFWMVALDSQRIVSNALAIYAIHKLRRRTMIFFTGGVCVGSHLAIAAYTYARMKGILPYDAVWIPALLLNLQIFSIAMGMVPLPSVIAGEVFPLEYRSTSGSISTGLVSGFMFFLLKTFPTLVENIGIYGTYTFYAGLLIYCLVVIWFMLPETKGQTLQQIEDRYKEVKEPSAEDGEAREKLQNGSRETKEKNNSSQSSPLMESSP